MVRDFVFSGPILDLPENCDITGLVIDLNGQSFIQTNSQTDRQTERHIYIQRDK